MPDLIYLNNDGWYIRYDQYDFYILVGPFVTREDADAFASCHKVEVLNKPGF